MIKLRRESSSDLAAIHELTAAAFLDAPHASHTEHFIVDALRQAGQLTVSIVAENDSEIVGHVAVSPVTISGGSSNWYGLGPISVVPKCQLQGVGSRLMRQALTELRELGAAGCVLLGDPRYYGRFGFEAVPGLVFPDVPPEYFQAISFGASVPAGTVAFHEAFNARGPKSD